MRRCTRREAILRCGALIAAGTGGGALATNAKGASTPPIELANRFVKARFTVTERGVRQEYFARAADGEWVLLAGNAIVPDERPKAAAPLYSDQGEWQRFRLLNANLVESVGKATRKGLEVAVLSGASDRAQSTQIVSLGSDDRHFHIRVETELPGDVPRLEYALTTFAFEPGTEPDFTYVPSLKRAPDGVSPDRTFHTPAVMIQKGRQLVALVPDLDAINDNIVIATGARAAPTVPRRVPAYDPQRNSFPTILDLDLQSGISPKPVFSYGFADFAIESHVYWRHDNRQGGMVRKLSSRTLVYEFDLLLEVDAVPLQGYRQVARFHWPRYGAKQARKPRPQAMPFAEYAKVCLPAAFAYQGDTPGDVARFAGIEETHNGVVSPRLPSWLEFELDAQPVGGIRCTTQAWYDDIHFAAWFNNARDAVGLHWWGQQLQQPDWIDKARRIINLALLAPQNNGIFPSVFRYSSKSWYGTLWKFDASYDKNVPIPWTAAPFASKDNVSNSYQPASASVTSLHLLRYHQLCESDDRIIPYVRAYAEFLLPYAMQGCVPGWFEADLKPSRALLFNAEGGVHIKFLTELFVATGDQRYLDAARTLAAFLREEILPQQKWFDFETFFSCSIKPETFFDARTGQYPQNNWSLVWAIEGLTALAKATGDPGLKDMAAAVADYSQFFQTSWQPHFIVSAYAFGGFRCQNSDGEWMNGSHLFAGALLAVAQLTQRQDLYERAVCALRSSFGLINLPRHVENGIFSVPTYPVGIAPENLDHGGFPQVNLRSDFDWGEGGALLAAAEILRQCGGIYIDAAGQTAVGIDGITVKRWKIDGRVISLEISNLLAELPRPWDAPYTVSLRICGLRPGTYQLSVNGKHRVTVSDGDLRSYPLVIEPHA